VPQFRSLLPEPRVDLESGNVLFENHVADVTDAAVARELRVAAGQPALEPLGIVEVPGGAGDGEKPKARTRARGKLPPPDAGD
jgi:hypothetical protein